MRRTTNNPRDTMTIYHRILADDWRRIAIEVLEGGSAISLEELAEEIATRNGGSTDPAAVKVALHHKHAPLLQDVGAIDYDREGKRITPVGPVVAEVADLARTTAARARGGRGEVAQ